MYQWEEEVMLMVEEMCYIICYMDWHSHYWQSLVFKHEVLDAMVREGLKAYAEKRAYVA